jgi:hypothetical protein
MRLSKVAVSAANRIERGTIAAGLIAAAMRKRRPGARMQRSGIRGFSPTAPDSGAARLHPGYDLSVRAEPGWIWL